MRLQRSCPVCGARDGTALHHQAYEAPAELGVPADVDIVACSTCGSCFADLPTKQEVLDESYRDHSKYADTSLYAGDEAEDDRPELAMPTDAPWDLQRLEGTASWLATQIPLDPRVLDAGCATGALLGFLKQQGFTSIVGLDPSPIATATASRTYKVPTVTGSFFNPPDDIGHFDLVVLSHVLEHLADVAGAIAGMWNLTRPGGHVYIEVPDAERYADYLVAPFHDFNTEHINHFSSRTLRLSMELAGFETSLIGHKEVLCSPIDLYPATFGLFRRPSERELAPSIQRDDVLVSGIERYVTDSNGLLVSIGQRIIAETGSGPVVLWGAGQLSMKLLAGPLRGLDVTALVDTSASKWGLRYGRLEVIGPDRVPDDDSPILVTSIHHQESISASIAATLPGRTVITLRD